MPIYEYQCTKCGHQIEALQKFSEPPLTECELCHGKVRKLISPSTFHLKGSGWYVTDYASKAGATQTATPKVEKADTKTETTASSDSPAKKDSSASAKSDK